MNDIFKGADKAQTPAKVMTGSEIKALGQEVENKLIDTVTALQEGGLKLPEGYNYTNAIKYAWLKLQGTEDKSGKNVLETCTQTSIANAMLAMILKGENMLYNHGYFIPYGDRLTYSEDYRGMLMRAIRDTNIVEVNAQVIYEGDNFVYEVDKKGRYQFVKHETKMENIDVSKIVGGYAIVTYADGSERLELMNMKQIKAAWAMGASKGASMAHTGFTDQMVIRTLLKRAVKIDLGKCSETVVDDEEDEVDPIKEQRDNANDGIEVPEVQYEDATEITEEPEPKKRNKKEDCPL